MTTALPAWLQWLQAVALVFIPVVGAWIAWQQVRIARAKLHFDLYEKRFAIFEAARKLISEAITTASVSQSILSTYTLDTSDAVFLLSDDIAKYLVDISSHAIKLSVMQSVIEANPVGSQQRIDIAKQIGDENKWFNEQLDALVARFTPFLKLDEPKRRR
jgi:hypothetical protein